ncbi:MAG TPA: calcium-binding protein [Microvirga sp.]|nr:calcium-binding protein [Microvirga sp.]
MATPVLWGSKFRLNTTTAGRQSDPQLCLLKDGSFVAVWVDDVPDDLLGTSIRGQFFNADGTKQGKEFLVSSSKGNNYQSDPVVTVLNDGRFVVAWDILAGTGPVWDQVRARVFQPNGIPIGRQFVVDEYVDNPSLTSLSNGGFAVAYVSYDQSDDHINTQVFGPSLRRIGDEATVNTSTLQAGPAASLVSLQDRYMAIFLDSTDDNRILGRILHNDGSTPPSATDFVIAAGEEHSRPVATKLSDGRIVVAWVSHRDAGTPFEVYAVMAQILNADGTKSGGELVLSASGLNHCDDPVIAASAEGGFTLAYLNQRGNSASIRVAAFDENGLRTGGDLLIDKFAYNGGNLCDITALADGRVVVAWEKDFTGKKVDAHAQIVDPRQKAVDLAGTGSKDRYFGTRFDDKLAGAEKGDLLSGSAGHDTIHGGTGNDKLYGGPGKDVFVFDAEPNKSTNVDRIIDFNPRHDALWLEDSVFAELGSAPVSTPVKFKSDMFVKGRKAQDRQDRIVYDSGSGALYYDQDGTGSKAQVKIAILPSNLKLTHSDFFVS